MSSLRLLKTSTVMPCQKFKGRTGSKSVKGIIHLPDGERIITCSWDGSLRVWNLESGKQIGNDWRDGESRVSTIALSPDGKKFISGGMDGAVRLWNIDTGKVIAKWIGHANAVSSVCWSRDGLRVLSGSSDGTARQWDMENKNTILGIVTGHCVYAVVYSPGMAMVATGGSYEDENFIKIWDAKTHKLIKILKGHTSAVWRLVWTADGKTIISGSFDSSIRTWNTTTWQQIAVLAGHTSINDISLSPNGRIIATAPTDETAHLWNLENGQHISSLPQPKSQSHSFPANAVNCVSFSADGKVLATGCSDNSTYIWDISAILKEAGLDNLLLDQNLQDKALPLNDDATRRPVQRHHDARRVLPGFFDDPPDHSHFSSRRRSSAGHHRAGLSSVPHGSTLLGRFLSLFRRTHSNPCDISGTQRRPDSEAIQHHSAVVDVPHAQGKRRNASAREKRRPIPLKPKNAAAGSSRPPKASATQQPSGAAHPQSSLQSLATVSPSTTPIVAATSAATTSTTPPPHVTIRYAGRWTRFWLFICCTSPEYTEGHH